jgi:branched-chain amino acid transport system ATP-binding protein
MPFFEVKDVHKRFGHQVVLERINLSFEQNELSGIMGPNGAGKTTCFNIMTGKYQPNSGDLFFKGNKITGLNASQIANRGISRSFQIINVFDDYTVLQNVLVAMPAIKKSQLNMFKDVYRNGELADKAMDILEQVNLEDFANVEAQALSYGQRRALEIGIAMGAEPELLFLDEPTQGLGVKQTVKLSAMIHKLKEKVTIVMIEHDMHFLFDLADSISVIHWGQVITKGSPAELQQNKWVKQSSLGDIH